MSEHKPMGLAAVARAAKDPRITVTALVSAIEAGTITPTVENGKQQVTLAQARSLLEPAPVPAPAPIKIKSTGKARRGSYGDRNPKGPSGT